MNRIAFAVCLLLACAYQPIEDGRYVMGTVLEIRIERGGDRALLDALFEHAEKLEQIMSRFRPDSDLSRLNRSAGNGPQPVPAELAEILAESAQFGGLTQGTFDITVGPLITLWRRAVRDDSPPRPTEIRQTLRRAGIDKLRVDRSHGTAELPVEGMELDLGGIGKGFTLDRLTQEMRQAGVRSALLSFGQSSLQAIGKPVDAPGWRVLIRDPRGRFAGSALLRDRALSVSSSLAQPFRIGGKRYGHILDPRTGQPLTRPRLAAVVAPSGSLAEALSKAALVLDADAVMALFETLPETQGLLLEADGQSRRSRGWDRTVEFEPIPAEIPGVHPTAPPLAGSFPLPYVRPD